MNQIALKGSPSIGLAGATLGFFVGFAAVSLFGPTVSFLKSTSGLSPALAGLLISIPSLSGSLLRIPFAAMVEKNGGRTPLLILLIMSFLGVAGISAVMLIPDMDLVQVFPWLLVLGTLGGSGIAVFSVGIAQTSYWFPQKRQGGALGIFGGVGNLAPGIFTILLTSVTIPFLGLPMSYVLWTVFLGLGILTYFFLGQNAWYFQLRKQGLSEDAARSEAKSRGQEIFPSGTALQSLAASAKAPETWLLVLLYFATFGGFLALTAWLPSFGTSYLKLDLPIAGLLTALYSIGTSVVRVLGGGISDKLGGFKSMVAALGLSFAGAILVALGLGAVFTTVGLVLMALGMGLGNAACFKLVPQFIPKAVGGAAGWIGGLGGFGGFVLPLGLTAVLGINGPGTGYSEGFWIFAAIFAACFLILAILNSRRTTAGKGK